MPRDESIAFENPPREYCASSFLRVKLPIIIILFITRTHKVHNN